MTRQLTMIAVLTALASATIGASSARATSDWGCFQVQHVQVNDVLMLRKGPSSSSQRVGELHPRQHGIIAEDGPCKPANRPPSRQWCPIVHYNGDTVERGWARLVYLAPSQCP